MVGCDVFVHHFETVAGSFPSCSANHLLERFFSTSITLILFMSFVSAIFIDFDMCKITQKILNTKEKTQLNCFSFTFLVVSRVFSALRRTGDRSVSCYNPAQLATPPGRGDDKKGGHFTPVLSQVRQGYTRSSSSTEEWRWWHAKK